MQTSTKAFSPRPQQGQPTGNKQPAPPVSFASTGRGENLSFDETKIPKNFAPARPTPPPVKKQPQADDNPFHAVPPHSDETERAVIGSMLMERVACEYAREFLTSEMFYLPRNRFLYLKCIALMRTHKAIDEVILTSSLQASAKDADDLKRYVGDVIKSTPSAANIEGYVNTLIHFDHERRRLAFALRIVADVLKSAGAPAQPREILKQ